MVQMTLHSLAVEKYAVFTQLARFVISGALVTALGVAVYGFVALVLRWHPQLGNFLAYAIAMGVGYVTHSRWSFRDHGSRTHATKIRFVMVSLASLALNSFWVWILTVGFHLSPAWPIIPMMIITPVISFTLNRQWVFR